MLANEVLLQRFIGLSRHFHGLVDQRHLVDEQIAEHTGAVHDNVDPGAAELFEGDQLKLVDATDGIGHRFDTDEPEDLSQRLAVSLDVVGSPEHAGDGLGPGALLLTLAFDQFVHHALGCSHSGTGGNSLRIQGMNVLAAGQHAWIADRISTRSGQHIFAIECLEQALHLHVGADLIETETQIAEQFVELRGIDLDEAGSAAGSQPGGGQLEAEPGEQVVEPAEAVAQTHTTVTTGEGSHHRSNGSAGRLGDRAVEFNIGENAFVIPPVDLFNAPAHRLGKQTGQRAQAIFLAFQGSDVHQRGDRFLRRRRLADGVQTTGQQATLDLHELAVHRTDEGIPSIEIHGRCIVLREFDILIEIALTGCLHDRVDDLDAAPALAKLLIGADELTQFLQTFVEPCVFSRGCEVADGGGVAPALGDRGLRRVVGRVVVEVRQSADQRIRVAGFAHAHLLAGHELQRTVRAEMEHRIGAPDLLEIGVVGRKAMVGTGTAGIQQTHRITLVTEGGLHADEHVAEVAAEHQQVLPVAVEIARRLAPVLLQSLRIRGETLVFLDAHPMGDGQLRSSLHRLGVVDHRLQQCLGCGRQILHVVPLGLHLLHHTVDGTEDVEVGRRPDIALVGGETEDRDRQLLVGAGLDPQG